MTTTADDFRGWFAVPAPVRSLFNHFPLRVYDSDTLPYRSPDTARTRPSLYIFAEEPSSSSSSHSATDHDRPSYNPSCLKWQTVLRIAGVSVDIVPSNNHASPSGALPFLLPPTTAAAAAHNARPLTGDKILKYAQDHAAADVEISGAPHNRLEVYQSLISQSIRPAWLHALYINPANFPLLRRLYLPSSLLSHSQHRTLRSAAEAEILKTSRQSNISHVRPQQLRSDLEEALSALSTLLGDNDDGGLSSSPWFFGAPHPGEFDADVFAYTWLMLDEDLGWDDDVLARSLRKFPNLVAHRERLYKWCWGDRKMK